MNTLVFDIETIPDLKNAERIYDLSDLSSESVRAALCKIRRDETNGHEFMRLHLQKIIVISAVFRHNDKLAVWSLGQEDTSESELIARFFEGIQKYGPTLVSWNGSAFDLPVLHYRALLHGIAAPRYWEVGEQDPNFRYNNYLNRFHYRHLDLMDVMAGYQAKAVVPLDQLAVLLGFPGKLGMSGDRVFDCFQQGDIKAIRNYCETDVLNTYLIYLRFETCRGRLSKLQYQQECELLRNTLKEHNSPHLDEFLAAWPIDETIA